MSQTVIVGGGVIGLSLAYELACRFQAESDDQQIVLLDRDRFATRASYAGAGALLPANMATAIHPFEQLEGISNQMHGQWANRLETETGIDNGYRECGGLYVARTLGEIALLMGTLEHWRQREIPFFELDSDEVVDRFPAMQAFVETSPRFKAIFVPSEYQFRNPDHLRALMVACEQRGVQLVQNAGELSLTTSDNRVVSVGANEQTWNVDQICVAAGPWTPSLLQPLGIELPMQPVRGHIALYKLPQQVMVPIINEGSRYLVPRDDGHVLAGSTIEESDFDDSVQPEEMAGLQRWGTSVLSDLNDTTLVDSWAGLRPGTFDGFPYMGECPGFENAFVSTGHFKSGLQISTGSAAVMADLIQGKSPAIDLSPFAISRVSDTYYRKSTDTA